MSEGTTATHQRFVIQSPHEDDVLEMLYPGEPLAKNVIKQVLKLHPLLIMINDNEEPIPFLTCLKYVKIFQKGNINNWCIPFGDIKILLCQETLALIAQEQAGDGL